MKKTICHILAIVLLLSAITINADGLLPSLEEAFAQSMPNMTFALDREPIYDSIQEEGNRLLAYYPFSKEDYKKCGCYLKSNGYKVLNYEGPNSECNSELFFVIGKDNTACFYAAFYSITEEMDMKDEFSTPDMAVFSYPEGTFPEENAGIKPKEYSDSIFPNISWITGAKMPNLSNAIGKKPDEISSNEDGTTIYRYNTFSVDDYEIASTYLLNDGCTVDDYYSDGKALHITIVKNGKSFFLTYDPSEEKAIVEYPVGTYSEGRTEQITGIVSATFSPNYRIQVKDDSENEYIIAWTDVTQYFETENPQVGDRVIVSCIDYGAEWFTALSVKKNSAESATLKTLPIISINNAELDKKIQEQNVLHSGMGIYAFHGNWLFGLFNQKNNMGFGKKRTDGTDLTIFEKGVVANCISFNQGYVYYTETLAANGEEEYGIYRMKESGGEKTLLFSGKCKALQVKEDFIYYTNGQDHLCRIDKSGKGNRLLINKEVYHWFVFDDAILYQDDADRESLHVCDLTGQNDIKLNSLHSWWPIFDGDYIYYCGAASSKGGRSLYRMEPNGNNNTLIAEGLNIQSLLMYGDYLYYTDGDDSNRIYRIAKDGNNRELIIQDPYCQLASFSGDFLFFLIFNKGDYSNLKNVSICFADGSNRRVLIPS